MSATAYEIEIKTLLGSKDNAEALISRMKQKDPALQSLGSYKQLNHYFEGNDLKTLSQNLAKHLPKEKAEILSDIAERVKDFSVRTRATDQAVKFVLKASVDDTTSSNGTARMEFETKVKMALDELDKLILDSGFKYQAKWSRERQDFKFQNMNVSIDKNAGYGYLAEFEIVSEDESQADALKRKLRETMSNLGVEELNQDRLARMFDYYNTNWKDYYGTEKVFNIE